MFYYNHPIIKKTVFSEATYLIKINGLLFLKYILCFMEKIFTGVLLYRPLVKIYFY
jgi:hypothetical protein